MVQAYMICVLMEDSERLVITFEAVLNGLLAFRHRLVGHVAAVVRQVAKLQNGDASLIK